MADQSRTAATGWASGQGVCPDVAIPGLVHLTRPVAMAAYTTAVLVNLFWLTVPAVLAWFAPLFFLKLLVCHLTPSAPLAMKTDD
ncbi:hypothetical protein [Streptomyces sp. 8K308]|uniref:hypothetical protein n=1 Tax=Streptomyces sp. 8K308 TaxID=2530388 RepID=UPI0014052BF3|nr:hypothetical protein [Streptomyces sp. 8K308]